MYEIKKNMSEHIPTNRKKYPFSDMEIGDSFLAVDISMNTVSPSCVKYGKALNMKFSVRHEGENSSRVWRIA